MSVQVKTMNQERIKTNKQPLITIAACHSDLIVRSWAETAVLVKGDDYEVNENEAELTLTSNSALQLTVPIGSSLAIHTANSDVIIKGVQGAVGLKNAASDAKIINTGPVKIGEVYGDLAAKNIDGNLSVEKVYGDTAVRNCGDLAVGAVYGDLIAKGVQGMAQLAEVMGDVILRSVSGDVSLKKGLRDVNLRGLNGDMNTISHAAGDIRLRGPLNPGQHSFKAGGDIVLYWPTNADLSVTAAGSQIKNRLPLEDVIEADGSLVGRMGDKGTAVSLESKGRIILKALQSGKEKWADSGQFDFDFDFDAEGLGAMINEQMLGHVNRLTADLEMKFGPDFSEKITQKVELAAQKAEKAAERALRQAERSLKRSWRRPPAPPRAPKPPTPPKTRASSEEQLKILKMVENGIISPDEAGTLLEALEN